MSTTVLITGGGKGIGREISKHLIDQGYQVISLSRSDAGNIKSKNFNHYDCDISNEPDIKNVISEIKTNFGTINGVINNAGFSEWRPIEKIDQDFLNNIFSINLFGSFIIIRESLDMLENNGCIINISSIAGKRGTINNSAYCATKFAMNGMTQALSKELGNRKIRVNALCPVLIKTDGLIEALNSEFSPANKFSSTEEFLNHFIKNNSSLDSLPDANDVSNMVSFLLSNQAKSITGQCINIDCGVLPQ